MFYLRVDDNIVLRLLTEDHSERLYMLIEANRTCLQRWLPWVEDTQTLAATRRFVQAGYKLYVNEGGLQAGIWFCHQLAGVISLNHINHIQKQTEIGYWLGMDFQGQGIMTRACRTLTGYVFDEMEMQHVEIRCAVNNLKSRAIPERLGYEVEGTSAQLDWSSDHYIQTVVYGMWAENWPPQSQS